MDWTAAVDRQRQKLVAILATLVAMAAGGTGTLPRHLHRTVLKLLRPAEAAARRLVIALARTLPASPAHSARPLVPHPSVPQRPSILTTRFGTGILLRQTPPSAPRPPPENPSLPLFDRLRTPASWLPRRQTPAGVPRISVPGESRLFAVPVRHPLTPFDPINASRLRLRLKALAAALDDLPAQARRFARWQARLHAAASGPQGSGGGPKRAGRASPLKPGRPPGWRRKPMHSVDEVLNDAHGLALWAMERPDTS